VERQRASRIPSSFPPLTPAPCGLEDKNGVVKKKPFPADARCRTRSPRPYVKFHGTLANQRFSSLDFASQRGMWVEQRSGRRRRGMRFWKEEKKKRALDWDLSMKGSDGVAAGEPQRGG